MHLVIIYITQKSVKTKILCYNKYIKKGVCMLPLDFNVDETKIPEIIKIDILITMCFIEKINQC